MNVRGRNKVGNLSMLEKEGKKPEFERNLKALFKMNSLTYVSCKCDLKRIYGNRDYFKLF